MLDGYKELLMDPDFTEGAVRLAIELKCAELNVDPKRVAKLSSYSMVASSQARLTLCRTIQAISPDFHTSKLLLLVASHRQVCPRWLCRNKSVIQPKTRPCAEVSFPDSDPSTDQNQQRQLWNAVCFNDTFEGCQCAPLQHGSGRLANNINQADVFRKSHWQSEEEHNGVTGHYCHGRGIEWIHALQIGPPRMIL